MILLKSVLKKAFIILFCGVLFFGISYTYLYFNFKETAAADQKDYNVPYKNLPDNVGVSFLLPDSSALLMYFDFENNIINVVNIEQYDFTNDLYYGYTANFIVQLDYYLIAEIIDRVGGVNIELNGEVLRYTGVQIMDLISSNITDDLKPKIITSIFNQISQNKLSTEDFLYIIENSEGDLEVVDCIYWLDYATDMFSNINFVN